MIYTWGTRGWADGITDCSTNRAIEIARSAVQILNSQDVDLVVVLGDLTQSGTTNQLSLARQILSKLKAPWYVLPGNHDRSAVQSGAFDREFGEHMPDFYCSRNGLGLLFLREQLAKDVQEPGYRVGADQALRAAEVVGASNPATLLAFSHVPVVSEQAFAHQHGGRYAGHYSDGLDLLRLLNQVIPTVLIFCAHQHWHHVAEGPGWIQCTTGALIEYPMEIRVVLVGKEKLTITTLAASPLASESLDSAEWVRGRACDRVSDIQIGS